MVKDTSKTRTANTLLASTTAASNPPPASPATPAAANPAVTGTPPADAPAVKVTTEAATQPVLESVQTSTGPTGEPRSAEIEPQLPRSAAFRARADASFDPEFSATGRSTYAGTLPAKTRVLASGERIEISAVAPDTETRKFTAAIRILKSKVLYEPGAKVPLTRIDFEAKRSRGSILERFFEDGEEAGETASAG
ncbi:hypothetical protein E3C22_16635 [Jiella endophytica]|uniref:Uncharacterized protein n=1 Tax=Jiella endophytica TaxID=2558362 RepID=A0A4Y8RE21_9HYPH|nr:hypothetical protein [Jiella endophytica]TFF20535.1 hypothetical protein E3C22_16635 [Jiella endophytica]